MTRSEKLVGRLVDLEQRFGGFIDRVPRRVVSGQDPRTPEEIAFGGYRGGDRMNPEYHGYAPAYAEALLPLLGGGNLVICEVGILTGIGLAIWKELFPSATVMGLDIDLGHTRANMASLVRRGAFAHGGPELHEFDQFRASVQGFAGILKGRKIDVLIDDGFHSDETILRTFAAARPHLSRNFVFFAEDNGTVYHELVRRYPDLDVRRYGTAMTIITPVSFNGRLRRIVKEFAQIKLSRSRLRRWLNEALKKLPNPGRSLVRYLPKRNRRVVYTCLFGYSEPFLDHKYSVGGRMDFICFTDDKSLASRNWQIKYIDSAEVGPVKTAKMVKLMPHRFLGEYGCSLYIDNTVKLKSPPLRIFECLEGGGPSMVCFKHPDRDCVYDEAGVVMDLGLDRPDVVLRQMDEYERIGHPRHAGLIAGTMLLRRHDDNSLNAVSEGWFEEVRKHSYRDQLSFNVVARLRNYSVGYFPGGLRENEFMTWPVSQARLPRDFDNERYLSLHADVKAAGMNPRRHYLYFGAAEGRAYK